jgi:hypothetical protein
MVNAKPRPFHLPKRSGSVRDVVSNMIRVLANNGIGKDVTGKWPWPVLKYCSDFGLGERRHFRHTQPVG